MKKIISIILGLGIFYFMCFGFGGRPEDKFVKHMKQRYNKEVEVFIYQKIISQGEIYMAKLYPKEIVGTPKEYDSYYCIEARMSDGKIEHNYLNLILQEQANNFYLSKLKELFGEDVLPVFILEGKCMENNLHKELARRKETYVKNPSKGFNLGDYDPVRNYDGEQGYDLLIGNIYIFAEEKDITEKEIYREKIYKFIDYMRKTGAFEHTVVNIKIMDKKFFDKKTFDEIWKKEADEEIKRLKNLFEFLNSIPQTPSFKTEMRIIQKEDDNLSEKREELENQEKTVDSTPKDMKDILEKGYLSIFEELLNKYGKVLLSSRIEAVPVAQYYTSDETSIKAYLKKEDIRFFEEELKNSGETVI